MYESLSTDEVTKQNITPETLAAHLSDAAYHTQYLEKRNQQLEERVAMLQVKADAFDMLLAAHERVSPMGSVAGGISHMSSTYHRIVKEWQNRQQFHKLTDDEYDELTMGLDELRHASQLD